MIRRRLLYLALLAMVVYTMMLYTFPGLRLLFAFLLLVPAAGLLQLLLCAFWVKSSLGRKRLVCSRGDRAVLALNIDNKGFLPITQMRIQLDTRDDWGGQKRSWRMVCGIDSRSSRTYSLEVPTDHCGQVIYHLRRTKLYDYLGICTFTRHGRKQRTEIAVMPCVIEVDIQPVIQVLQERRSFLVPEESDTWESRAYQEGDSLHRVHWKLSARMEELQVREAIGNQQKANILLQTQVSGTSQEEQRKAWDNYLDLAYSLLLALHQADFLQAVYWYQDGEPMQQEITGRKDIDQALLQLMMLPKRQVNEEYNRHPEWLFLDSDRRLYRGEECIYEA